MARKFIEGFEGNSFDGWLSWAASVGSASGKDMSGNYCADLTNYNSMIQYTLGASLSTIYLAFKWRGTSTYSAYFVTLYDSAGTAIATVFCNTTSRKMELRLGNHYGTLLDTGDTIFANNQTYLIEVLLTPLNSGGTFTVKVNGIEECTYSGDTTSGLENVQGFRFGDNGINNSYCYIDDVVVDDAAYPGNTKIQVMTVSGAGSTTSWDPSAGNNYACVDEIAYSDADYVSTNVADEVDTYALTDLAEAVSAIKCIQVTARCAYAGSPTPTKQEVVIRPASTNRSHATTVSPGVSFSRHDRIWEVNPEDSAAFEAADLNAMEVGIKAVA